VDFEWRSIEVAGCTKWESDLFSTGGVAITETATLKVASPVMDVLSVPPVVHFSHLMQPKRLTPLQVTASDAFETPGESFGKETLRIR
jgi:hypothetical protein